MLNDAVGAVKGSTAIPLHTKADPNGVQQAAQAPAGGFGTYKSAAADESVAVQTIQNVGNKTFFYRNQCWIDSAATEKLSKNTRKVKRYSDEYFQLITRYGRDAAKYLALEGHVIVILGGEAYEFQAAGPAPGK